MTYMLILPLVKALEHSPHSEAGYEQNVPLPNQDVQMMANALTKKVRGYKTARRYDDSLWIYRPQDTYAMGWIAYANVLESGNGEARYAVFSPNIANRKYEYGDKIYMSSTLNLDKAVRNASKYLRPLTTHQVISQAQPDFAGAVSNAKDVALREMRKVVADTKFLTGLTTSSPFLAELDRMLQSDYEFTDKQLKAQISESLNAIKEYEEISKLHNSEHTFIEVIQSQGENVYRGFKDTVMNYSLFHFDSSAENRVTYSQGELPENLHGAISVLSMVSACQYVSGVGYRAAENMFYILKGEV